MTENTTKDFIDNLAQGKNDDAGEAFKNALRGKVGDSLDQMRKDLAGNLFNGDGTVNTDNAAPHSDPKPEIADVGTFNQDGTISLKNDGQADLDLTQPSPTGVDIENA
tara:strand:+ start:551 stop:874 length:324 start_codon:yes stop_codon:yes gene_type:complete